MEVLEEANKLTRVPRPRIMEICSFNCEGPNGNKSRAAHEALYLADSYHQDKRKREGSEVKQKRVSGLLRCAWAR